MTTDYELKKFKEAGFKQVRMNIAAGIYGPRREKLAREWLKQNRPDWYRTPLGIVALTVIAIVVGAILLKVLGLN